MTEERSMERKRMNKKDSQVIREGEIKGEGQKDMSAFISCSVTAYNHLFFFTSRVHEGRGCVGVCLSGQIFEESQTFTMFFSSSLTLKSACHASKHFLIKMFPIHRTGARPLMSKKTLRMITWRKHQRHDIKQSERKAKAFNHDDTGSIPES